MKDVGYIFSIILLSVIFILTGCNKDNLSEANEIKLSLQTGSTEQLVNYTYLFKVEGNHNAELTAQSEYRVNGMLLTNNTFESSVPGTFKVKAYYKGIESNELVLTVTSPSAYSQKVLVEDYTGTWCGWCTRVWHAINLAKQQSNKIVSVAVHVDGNDPFKYEGSQSLRTTFGVGGLPAGRINRTTIWTNPEHENVDQVVNKTGPVADLGLSISSTLNNNVIDFSVKVGFVQNFSEPLNIVVYLVENGLVYSQVNYNSYVAGGQSPIPNFTHNDVLRAIYTDVFGETIPQNQTVTDAIYIKSFQKTIPESVSASNYQNLHLVAFVTDATTKEVINVQEVRVGESKDFD